MIKIYWNFFESSTHFRSFILSNENPLIFGLLQLCGFHALEVSQPRQILIKSSIFARNCFHAMRVNFPLYPIEFLRVSFLAFFCSLSLSCSCWSAYWAFYCGVFVCMGVCILSREKKELHLAFGMLFIFAQLVLKRVRVRVVIFGFDEWQMTKKGWQK